LAAAGLQFAVGGQDVERFDVIDDGFEFEATAVDVGGEGAAQGEAVGTGLFLDDAEGCGGEGGDEFGPFDAGFDVDELFVEVDAEDAVHGAHVEVDGVGGELLAAHGVAGAGEADFVAVFEERAELIEVRGAGDAEDAGGVELGVDVVELFAGVGGG
jgi:hypothetical protein